MKWLVLACLASAVCASNILSDIQDDMELLRQNERYLETIRHVTRADREDEHLPFVELVKKYGYPVEEYEVLTKDGYYITLHRIPHGKTNLANKQRGVVFMQHGILSSSVDWIIPGPEKGLAYMLADRGYDIWLGNARGNRYSKKHMNDEISKKDFWNFSWHEIGIYDLPTMIDFALEKTGKKNLLYVGHSQGTTAFYVMTSMKPEYNRKIRAHFSLAPIAYVNHMTSPLFQMIAKAQGSIGFLLNLIGVYEFLPTHGFLHNIAKNFCEEGILQPLCSNALFVMCGFNKAQFNTTLMPILMGHTPAGASTKQFLHYAQLINSGGLLTKGKFRQYDYGFLGNMERYGNPSPPAYDLSKITAPVYLFYSSNDWLSAEKDVIRLHDELGNLHAKFLNPDKNFNHLDYTFGIDADILVYDKIMSLMLRH